MSDKIKLIKMFHDGAWFVFYEVGKESVKDIKDMSIELEKTHTPRYEIFDKDKNLMILIENCPVIVEYFRKGEIEK